MQNNEIEIITLEEKHFVGVAVTNAFQKISRESIKEANQIFLDRMSEIKGVLNPLEYVCPHFANDILFTYIYCLEVGRVENVPKGMVGFTVPSQRYAKIRSKDQDPYTLIHSFLKEKSMAKNLRSLALEVFRFGEEQHTNNADIYVPILEVL